MNDTAVFAGSFDPFTLGHYEVAKRASEQFARVIVAVSESEGRKCMFGLSARVTLARLSVADLDNVEVVSFGGLLVDFMKKVGSRVLVRGLRNTVDFEYERALLGAYKAADPAIESCYFISSPSLIHVSASAVRELVTLGGDYAPYVKPAVAAEIAKITGGHS